MLPAQPLESDRPSWPYYIWQVTQTLWAQKSPFVKWNSVDMWGHLPGSGTVSWPAPYWYSKKTSVIPNSSFTITSLRKFIIGPVRDLGKSLLKLGIFRCPHKEICKLPMKNNPGARCRARSFGGRACMGRLGTAAVRSFLWIIFLRLFLNDLV